MTQHTRIIFPEKDLFRGELRGGGRQMVVYEGPENGIMLTNRIVI